jgi:hypothetical protein
MFIFIISSAETDPTTINCLNVNVLETKKQELEEDNNILRIKLEFLLEMLAQVTAEDQLQQTSNT